jgi:hypothetical protein
VRRARIASALAVVMAMAGFTVLPAQASVGCYGDYCSGLDPMTTGCANDARTIASASVYGSNGAAYVDIRWSPACKTNWARANYVTSAIKSVQQHGYTQGYSANNGVNSWSRMIYSPVLCVKGVIWGGWGVTETSCV